MASSFALPASQAELQQRVAHGDAEAAGRLARYYAFIERDENKALLWYQKAAEIGGQQEREEYESFKTALLSYAKAVESGGQ